MASNFPTEFVTTLCNHLQMNKSHFISRGLLEKIVSDTQKKLSVSGDFTVDVRQYGEKNEHYTVVEIVGNDMPFIVDSTSHEIKACALNPLEVLYGSAKRGDGSDCFIMYYFFRRSEQFDEKDIKKRLLKVLECVQYTTCDWESIQDIVRENIKKLSDNSNKGGEHVGQLIKLLEWLLNDNFLLFGSTYLSYNGEAFVEDDRSKLGLVRSDFYEKKVSVKINNFHNEDIVFVRKTGSRSLVHRSAQLDAVYIKQFDLNGEVEGVVMIVGFFASLTSYQSVQDIPVISSKISNVMERYDSPPQSFNNKEMLTVIQSFPITELFQITEDVLYNTSREIVRLTLMPKLKLFIHRDSSNNFLSCLLFVPKRVFSSAIRKQIEKILSNEFHSTVSRSQLNITESDLVRLYVVVNITDSTLIQYDTNYIENKLSNIVTEWDDQLKQAMKSIYSEDEAEDKFSRYVNGFPLHYAIKFDAVEAANDVKLLESAIAKSSVEFNFYNDANEISLKIYAPLAKIDLSEALHVAENYGFKGISMHTYKIDITDKKGNSHAYIHYLRLSTSVSDVLLDQDVKQNIEKSLRMVEAGSFDNDEFNLLMLFPKISWLDVLVVRAYYHYLKQIKFNYSKNDVVQAFVNNRGIFCDVMCLFNDKFHGKKKIGSRVFRERYNAILSKLDDISDIKEDKIIRMYLSVIDATQRINSMSVSDVTERISFKIKSSIINDMPLPKPFMEIFVYSTKFEGVHLRGGKVARGGLRWSDRLDDYRTEVLGLMKAQMTKNSVIVPVGSKGGFVLKMHKYGEASNDRMAEGTRCYKMYLRGILDITDNMVGGAIVKPNGVHCYDEDDCYLVVAADKGTASFSDYANEISREYGFWLDDAFASGGSAGYDHKKMGITAKGAWISVEQHLAACGISDEFTVVGIGDMSGDVFGNGMLLSQKIRLVAAFNHKHIFIDPQPNALVSYKERKRLFALKGSGWDDYNKEDISSGGGVFERKAKSIALNDEIRNALSIKHDISHLTPDELIVAILKAPVDLLWNGGIGTYVKAHYESHDEIGDKVNNNLRVDGKELSCKIVGEGGNLGFTQNARREYADCGGKINTDFIDNSAGVDCSDHEVNMKIAFAMMIADQKVSIDGRNAELEQMSDDVSSLVLLDNTKQTKLISMEEHFADYYFSNSVWLMQYLDKSGELDRISENLPSDEEVQDMIISSKYFSRPELSVLIAYAKNSIAGYLSGTHYDDHWYFAEYLFSYFPEMMKQNYTSYLVKHPLRNEIITTHLVNDFVNMLGISSFHQVMDMAPTLTIMKAFVIGKAANNIDHYWSEVDMLDESDVDCKIKMELFLSLRKMVEHNMTWLLYNKYGLEYMDRDIADIVSELREQNQELVDALRSSVISDIPTTSYIAILLNQFDINEEVKKQVEDLPVVANLINMSIIAYHAQSNIVDTAVIYFEILRKLRISDIYSKIGAVLIKDLDDQIAIKLVVQDISLIIDELMFKVLLHAKDTSNASLDHILDKEYLKKYDDFVNLIKPVSSTKVISLLILLKKHIRALLS